MLVIVKDGDIQHALERFFDIEAFRSFDIFQVDAAESGRDGRGNLDDLIRVVRIDLDIKHVHIGEFLEEHAFAFHDRLAGQRPAVAQAQDGRAIREHRHQVALGGIFVGCLGILFDLQHRHGYTGGVCQAQVALRVHRLGGHHSDLARLAIQAMIFKRIFRGDFAHKLLLLLRLLVS